MVIALDTATDPEDAVDATFATDNTAAGELQGQWVKAALGDTEPTVVMLDRTPRRHGRHLPGRRSRPDEERRGDR